MNHLLVKPPTFGRNLVLALRHACTPYSARETAGLARTRFMDETGMRYSFVQNTKPQTIGNGLADSPVMLLAWIYEKLHDWTDDYAWTADGVLTLISLYWFSAAGPAASVRIYYEAMNAEAPLALGTQDSRDYIPYVKLGVARFPEEISIVPDTWA